MVNPAILSPLPYTVRNVESGSATPTPRMSAGTRAYQRVRGTPDKKRRPRASRLLVDEELRDRSRLIFAPTWAEIKQLVNEVFFAVMVAGTDKRPARRHTHGHPFSVVVRQNSVRLRFQQDTELLSTGGVR